MKVSSQRDTLSDFVKKANAKHNEKYSYQNSIYKNIIITWVTHGDFIYLPKKHLEGRECRKCEIDIIFLNIEKFTKRAREINENKYDYSHVVYTIGTEKIKILCTKHGFFWQMPQMHLEKRGCPSCYNKTEGMIKVTLESFILLLSQNTQRMYAEMKTIIHTNEIFLFHR